MIVAVIMVPVVLAVVIALLGIMAADAKEKEKTPAKQQVTIQRTSDIRSHLANSKKNETNMKRAERKK